MTLFIVRRTRKTTTATLGELYLGERLLCATLEDLPRPKKIPGQTRIPAGTYSLSLVQQSGFNYRYQKRWGSDWHRGIVTVDGVPDFSLIRWHIGNTHLNTAGCLLLGERTSDYRGGFLYESTTAYRRVYPIVRDAIEAGPVSYRYEDEL